MSRKRIGEKKKEEKKRKGRKLLSACYLIKIEKFSTVLS